MYSMPESTRFKLFLTVTHQFTSLLLPSTDSSFYCEKILGMISNASSALQFDCAEDCLEIFLTGCSKEDAAYRSLAATTLRDAALQMEEQHDRGNSHAFSFFPRLLARIEKLQDLGWDFSTEELSSVWTTAVKCGARMVVDSFPCLSPRLETVINQQLLNSCKGCTDALIKRAKRSHGVSPIRSLSSSALLIFTIPRS